MITLANAKNGVLFGILNVNKDIILLAVAFVLKIVLLVLEMMVFIVQSLKHMAEVLVTLGNLEMDSILTMPILDAYMIIHQVVNNQEQ